MRNKKFPIFLDSSLDFLLIFTRCVIICQLLNFCNLLSSIDKQDEKLQDFSNKLSDYSKGREQQKWINKWPYVWRSAVFPGWGQHYDRRKKTAYAYVGSFLFLTAYYATKLNKYRTAKKRYDGFIPIPATETTNTYLFNSTILSGYRSDYKSKKNTVNNSTAILGVFYLWNIFDAYWFSESEGGLFSFDLSVNPGYIEDLDLQKSMEAKIFYSFRF